MIIFEKANLLPPYKVTMDHCNFSVSTTENLFALTLKVPITTASDDKFCNVFLILERNKV